MAAAWLEFVPVEFARDRETQSALANTTQEHVAAWLASQISGSSSSMAGSGSRRISAAAAATPTTAAANATAAAAAAAYSSGGGGGEGEDSGAGGDLNDSDEPPPVSTVVVSVGMHEAVLVEQMLLTDLENRTGEQCAELLQIWADRYERNLRWFLATLDASLAAASRPLRPVRRILLAAPMIRRSDNPNKAALLRAFNRRAAALVAAKITNSSTTTRRAAAAAASAAAATAVTAAAAAHDGGRNNVGNDGLGVWDTGGGGGGGGGDDDAGLGGGELGSESGGSIGGDSQWEWLDPSAMLEHGGAEELYIDRVHAKPYYYTALADILLRRLAAG